MRLARVAGVLAVVALMACSDEQWLYRARDAGGANPDAGQMDVGGVEVGADGAVEDRGGGDGGVLGDDGMVPTSDVPVLVDGGMKTDTGPVATGLMLRAHGIATMEGGSSTVGTLRLSETGFEMGERGCVGALCIVGGLVP